MRLKSFYDTMQTFGIKSGGRALGVRAECKLIPSSRNSLRKLHFRGLPHPILLRPGTSDWSVLNQIFIMREYDCRSRKHNDALWNLYESLVSQSKTPVIVDCGANIGLASIWYAINFPRAEIIAIEPEPENFKILSMNAANFPNIKPVLAGISDHETHVSLSNVGDAPWAWQTTESESGQIQTRTIPGLLAEMPNSSLLIVKIDIEGAEVELFRSNAGWASDAPLIVFESHDWLFNWRGTFHAIASVLTRCPRDYLHNGENTFSFSHSMRAS